MAAGTKSCALTLDRGTGPMGAALIAVAFGQPPLPLCTAAAQQLSDCVWRYELAKAKTTTTLLKYRF